MQYCVSMLTFLCCINLNQKTSPDTLEGNRLHLSQFLIRNLTGHFYASKYKHIPSALAVLLRSKGRAVHIPQ